MKKVLGLLAVLVLFGVLGYFAFFREDDSGNEEAIQMNNEIVAIQTALSTAMIDFGVIFNDLTITNDEALEGLASLTELAQESSVMMTEITVVEGGENFHARASDLTNFYLETVIEDYPDFVSVAFDNDLNANDAERFQTLLENFAAEETLYFNAYTEAQQDFAELKGFSL